MLKTIFLALLCAASGAHAGACREHLGGQHGRRHGGRAERLRLRRIPVLRRQHRLYFRDGELPQAVYAVPVATLPEAAVSHRFSEISPGRAAFLRLLRARATAEGAPNAGRVEKASEACYSCPGRALRRGKISKVAIVCSSKRRRRKNPSRHLRRRATEPDALKGDESLIEDIRLLGRLLGDAVREHEGPRRLRAHRDDPAPLRRREPQRGRRSRQKSRRAAALADGGRGAHRDPRLQLFLASCQYRRRPASPAAARARAGERRLRRRAEPRHDPSRICARPRSAPARSPRRWRAAGSRRC